MIPPKIDRYLYLIVWHGLLPLHPNWEYTGYGHIIIDTQKSKHYISQNLTFDKL